MSLKRLLLSLVAVIIISVSEVSANCPNGRCGSQGTICPTDNSLFCSLCSDPRLCTFSEERARIDLLGNFLFSQFFYQVQNSPLKGANVTVVAETSRRNGRIFVSGLQLRIILYCENEFSYVFLNLATQVIDGQVVLSVSDLLGQTSDFIYNNTPIVLKKLASCCILSLVTTPDYFYVINIECFDIKIGIRPVESGLAPCIFVEVGNPSLVQFPPFNDWPSQLCLTNEFGIADLTQSCKLESHTDALNFLALTGVTDLNANITHQPQNVVQLGELVNECPIESLETFLGYLAFVQDHNLVNCISGEGNEEALINLAIAIAEIFCNGDQDKCSVVNGILENDCSSVSDTILHTFYSEQCSF
ncbi:hypothetical protein BgiMline_035575 [Biomphalaria glabrata]|uniref:Uncharacterized protein LOC106067460 n=1 Tax=Biomphalaria glabrata TaxID=6526 RepID=A0A9W2ZBA8_BIOGL|nr:uncharacterized protein LOC106067460 [Biomphalaria glabrata]KAI8730540.1 hypothetical protein BgiMline_030885 [Biomphalaria glabrata]KAI8764488.1 hypothetical protein BgiBS90_029873 [Biomphalaria glabrata]